MAIFRGIGGAGDSTTDATVTAVTEQATNAANSATSAASSASSASSSASAASTSASNAASSASSASTSAANAATSASNAASSASSANTAATNAAASETAAGASETAAAASESAAATSASNAASSASSASSSASTATTKASEASASASAASTLAGNAAASESNAVASAAAASSSETNAATSETNAANSATAASNSATASAASASAAAGSASAASTSETNAAASETAAAASETAAGVSETNAATSATNAATSESNALDYVTTAGTYVQLSGINQAAAETAATNAAASASAASSSASAASASETAAAASETAAADSETAAASSETAAATSASNAATSESNAATSESNAATSESNAATSESNAATSASNAATSASNAASSASSAASSASSASASADAALAALDSFDDRYLGQKASAPTLDNDGNALIAGALYFNTTTNEMKVYDGSTWLNAYASLSGALLATNNLSDLNNVATARTNLGLATSATTDTTNASNISSGTLDAARLANSGVTAGSYGSGSAIPTVTVDAKGRVTGVSTTAVDIPTLPTTETVSSTYTLSSRTNGSWYTIASLNRSVETDVTAEFVMYAQGSMPFYVRFIASSDGTDGDIDVISASGYYGGMTDLRVVITTSTAYVQAKSSGTLGTPKFYMISHPGSTASTTWTPVNWTLDSTSYTSEIKKTFYFGDGVEPVNNVNIASYVPPATTSNYGGFKRADATAQTVAPNTVSATAGRSYAVQLNSSGQGVVNVPWTDTTYTLPAATSTVRGGIELGSDTQQTVAANAVTATASRTYALQVNSAGQGVVNVPWSDTNTVYTHPTHPGDDIDLDTSPLTGATVISDLDFNVTTDTLGHVTDANATYSTRNLTAADVGAAPSSHSHDYVPERNRTDWNDATVIDDVIGQLAWKNYGNNHTIYDASAGTSPTGVAKNNTNPDVAWSATYPTLMGYNGTNTYGVRVDSSRYADQWKTARTNTVTLTGDVTGSGSASVNGSGNWTVSLSTTVEDDSHTHSIDSITDEHRLFNNMGDDHSTRSSFDASTPSYNFGWRYVQGNSNGPGVNSSTQYYSQYVGLGNQYPATGAGSYGMQIAYPRNVSDPYIAIRYNENNSLGTWRKISAGKADTLTTARTINGVSFDGSANITVADSTKLPLTGGTLTGDLTVNTTLNVRGAIDLADSDILRLGSSDDWEFFHNGTANYMDLNVGDLYVRDNTTTRFTFARTTGNFTATGNVTAYSDERLKKDWLPVTEDFVERLSKVKSGTYTRIDTNERQAGSSAQDWQPLLPEVVLEGDDEAKTLSIAYGNAALVSVIELAKRIMEQDECIKELRAEINKLKAIVQTLTGE